MTRSAISLSGRSLGPYSDAVLAGDLVVLSGRVGLDGDNLADGVAAQTRAAIGNAAAVLHATGLTLDAVVRCTVYLVDMEDFEVMNAAYAQLFDEPRPARTTVAVAALPLRARVEIEMTALCTRTGRSARLSTSRTTETTESNDGPGPAGRRARLRWPKERDENELR